MQFSPYSISKAGTYFQCPNKFKLNYIEKIKLPFVTNVALLKGSYIHLVIENSYDYDVEFKVNSVFTQEQKDIAIQIIKTFQHSELGAFYSKQSGTHEMKFGLKIVSGNLITCDYNDSDAWYRGAIDYQFLDKESTESDRDVLNIVDWKSGKSHAHDEEFDDSQSKMYAIFGFINNPGIDIIKAKFVYVEHAEERELIYYRENLTDYIKFFYNRTKTIENAKEFNKQESYLCGWCDFRKFGHCIETTLEEQIKGISGLDF